MANVTKRITIEVNDQFTQSLRNLTRELSQAERGVQGLNQAGQQSGPRWRQFGQDMFYFAQNAQMAFGMVQQAYQFADALVESGNALTKAQMAMTAMTGSEREAVSWMNAVRDATMGTITQTEALQFAYQEMNLGLANSAQQAGEFTRIAAIIGAASPQLGNTAEAISQISLTLANTSYLRLDQLGISSSLVRDKVAALRAETAGLSEQEAFQIAVMDELRNKADQLGTSMLEVDAKTGEFAARWADFKATTGQELSTYFEDAATSVMDFHDGLRDTIDAIKEFRAEGGGWGDVASATGNSIWDEIGGWQGVGEFIARPLVTPWDPLGMNQQIINSAVGGGGGGRGASQGVSPITGAFRLPPNAQQMLTNYADWVQGWSMVDGITRAQASSSFFDLRGENILASGALRPQAQPSLRTADTVGGGIDNEKIQALKDALKGLPEMGDHVSGAAQEMAHSLKAVAETVEKTVAAFTSLEEKFGTVQSSFDASVGGAMGDAMQEVGLSQEQMNSAMEVYAVLTGDANAQSLVFEGQMQTLAEQFQTGTLNAEEYARAVMELGQMDFSWADNLDAALSRGNISFDYYTQQIQRAGANGPTWTQAGQAAGGRMGGGWAGGAFGGAPGQESGVPITPQSPEIYVGALSLDTEEADGQIADFRSSIEEISGTAIPAIGSSFDTMLAGLDGKMTGAVEAFAASLDSLPDAEINVGVNVAPPHGSIWISWGAEGTSAGSGSTEGRSTPSTPRSGGNRAGGGPVARGSMYQIFDTSAPEVLTQGGRSYLLPGANGQVTPLRNMSVGGGGAGGGTVQAQITVMLDNRAIGQAVTEIVVPDRSGDRLVTREQRR